MIRNNLCPFSIAVMVAFSFGAFAQSDTSALKNQDPAIGENAPSPNSPPSFVPNNNGIPPGFEDVLPPDVVQKLRDLHTNTELSFSEKREKFDEIMNSVPGDILAKLPPPPGFDLLPEEVKEKINQIHTNTSLTWNEKRDLVSEIIGSLPPGNRGSPNLRRKSLNFPPTPPPGFENVLPKEVYDELVRIHTDPQLEPKEKIAKIDQIMRSQPKEILDKLPLPPGFDKLRPDLLQKARDIFSDTTLAYEEKNKAIIRFVKSLPDDQRALVRPPLPPALDQLPQDVKNEIDTVFLNEQLDEEQRDAEFWKIIEALPEEQRQKVYNELNSLQGPSGKPKNDGSQPV